MKLASAGAALALLALPAIAFGFSTPPPGKSGPPVVPYLCNEGRQASVVYESGNDYIHARALVTIDGRTIEMRAAPALYGVRYRSEGAGESLAWSLRGEQARLTESPDADGYTGEEHALADCVRLRGAPPPAGESHGGDAHGEDH